MDKADICPGFSSQKEKLPREHFRVFWVFVKNLQKLKDTGESM
jgi:hypothetical protein